MDQAAVSRRVGSSLGLGRPVAVAELRGGLGRPPLLISFPDTKVVLKSFDDNRSAAEVEYENLRVAADISLTPRALGIDLDGAWGDGVAIAMSWVDGRAGFQGSDDLAWLAGLARGLADVHSIAPPHQHPHVPQRLFNWIRSLAADESRYKSLLPVLTELETSTVDLVFSHGDYQPGNVLFRHAEVRGVVDWLDAAPRERAFDVAYCRAVLAIHPGGDAPDLFRQFYEERVATDVGCQSWDRVLALRSMRGSRGRWPEAFARLGVNITADDIWDRSARWFDSLG
ncbi:MAG TPA: aminoglycoside phosphotransferase family protein [Acidimicrobiales bacterium]|nr:aminoglycoside phosphotransferase family protein [Acidimicrobiales bacterium]